MSPLDIGILTWAYPPEKSGLSRAAREIAEALAETGQRVRVLTLDRDGTDGCENLRIVGVLKHLGWAKRLLRRAPAAGHLAAPLAFRAAVRAEHARRRFDIVEGTNWYAPGLFVSRAGNLPYVTRHSTPAATSIEQPPTLRNRCDAEAAKYIEAVSARASAGHISNRRAHGERIERLYRLTPDGAPHATVGLSLSPEFLERASAAPYPANASPLEILFVGRPEARKGFDLLCGALTLLASEAEGRAHPRLRAHLVGVTTADLLFDAEDVVEVRCYHRVEEHELHDLFSRAHIVAAPSRYESFGLVYQEALAYGRPLVALGGDASAAEALKDGGGILAAAPTAGALAAALGRLIGSEAARNECRAQALAAANGFTRASLAKETLALYGRALSADRKAVAMPSRPLAVLPRAASPHIAANEREPVLRTDNDRARRAG
ncbi:MAG: glycosyltransferase family 4 protein [Pacificimonas sp.]